MVFYLTFVVWLRVGRACFALELRCVVNLARWTFFNRLDFCVDRDYTVASIEVNYEEEGNYVEMRHVAQFSSTVVIYLSTLNR